jgi:hypothetical protein
MEELESVASGSRPTAQDLYSTNCGMVNTLAEAFVAKEKRTRASVGRKCFIVLFRRPKFRGIVKSIEVLS